MLVFHRRVSEARSFRVDASEHLKILPDLWVELLLEPVLQYANKFRHQGSTLVVEVGRLHHRLEIEFEGVVEECDATSA